MAAELFERNRRAGANAAEIERHLEARSERGRRAHHTLREITEQPAIYFTTDRPLPIYVCTSARTMDTAHEFGDRPDEWHHPDLGVQRQEWIALRDDEVAPQGAMVATGDLT